MNHNDTVTFLYSRRRVEKTCDLNTASGLRWAIVDLHMKYISTVFLIVAVFSYGNAQTYRQVDSIVSKYPKAFWSPEKLATRIKIDFHSDSTRARAIYVWMAKHIRYDVRKYLLMKQRKYADKLRNQIKPFNRVTYNEKIALRTLRTKKGVCGDYSILFDRLCALTQVESEVISGTGKTRPEDIGKMPALANHGWNAVKINNKWRLVDVTWGAGHVNLSGKKFSFAFDTTYFFTPPDLFFLNHFPRDKQWLLINRKDSAFAGLPLYHQLRRDITIISPSSGLIVNKSKYGIEFEVLVPGPLWVVYQYRRDKKESYVDVACCNSKGTVTFSVPPPRSGNDYLTLYFDGQAFATFKVKSRRFLRSPFTGLRGDDIVRR
jgi:hypothetical protein